MFESKSSREGRSDRSSLAKVQWRRAAARRLAVAAGCAAVLGWSTMARGTDQEIEIPAPPGYADAKPVSAPTATVTTAVSAPTTAPTTAPTMTAGDAHAPAQVSNTQNDGSNDDAADFSAPAVPVAKAPVAPAVARTPVTADVIRVSAPAPDVTADAPTSIPQPPSASSSASTQPSADAPVPFITVGSGAAEKSIHLLLNKSVELSTRTPYKRVSVGQPEIADVNLLGPGSFLLTGKKPGSTQVIVWDDSDKPTVVDVSVAIDIAGLDEQIKHSFPGLSLTVETVNGSVLLRGHVPSVTIAEQVMQIARPYSTQPPLDFLEVSGGQQVMLQVRFAEVSRSASTQLGINGAFTGKGYSFGNQVGGVNPVQVGNNPADNIANAVSSAVTVYGSGQMGSVMLEGFIDALRQNNLLRILAEPNLVTMSGNEASFLAGGEFPVPVSQGGSGGGAALSVEYREYGVKLKFVPVVLGDGKIRLKVAPEVSDLDYTNGVTVNGFRIPGTTERKVTTTVELAEGQTFAVAGLLKSNISANKDVVPLLGDLPVLGALFRSVRYENDQTELVVLVTPHIVNPMNPLDVPRLPGEDWRSPTENELFFDQYLGADMSGNKRPSPAAQLAARKDAPLFYGQYGYVGGTRSLPAGATADADH